MGVAQPGRTPLGLAVTKWWLQHEAHRLSHSPTAGVCWKMASLVGPHESVLYGVGSNPQYFPCQPPSKLLETPASSAVPRNSSTATCQLG